MCVILITLNILITLLITLGPKTFRVEVVPTEYSDHITTLAGESEYFSSV